jgi:DNA (cytosine-5)-methyltransferase 1
MNIFELMQEKYKLPKQVKLFEAFAGIGCQRMAFEKAGIDYKVVGISEIDKHALKSYDAMHGECPNFGSITEIKGKDMPEIDVFTYSFPCTDLSRAGKQKGLGDTRSGLVFEVLRILHEMKDTNNLPKVLIMENVTDLIGTKFLSEWLDIQYEIEQMGYSNYTFKMNAKDYGVAQNRDRVFMVSILGDYYYEEPQTIILEKRLKDYLEPDVDEKYYLSPAMLNAFTMEDTKGFNRAERFEQSTHTDIDKAIAFTINTRAGSRPTDNYIKQHSTYISWQDKKGRFNTQDHRAFDQEQTSGCVPAMERGVPKMYDENRKIRKLTPLECWRLMGIDDGYYHKASEVSSQSQLYKQAGNGIVVDVFAKILEQMK